MDGRCWWLCFERLWDWKRECLKRTKIGVKVSIGECREQAFGEWGVMRYNVLAFFLGKLAFR